MTTFTKAIIVLLASTPAAVYAKAGAGIKEKQRAERTTIQRILRNGGKNGKGGKSGGASTLSDEAICSLYGEYTSGTSCEELEIFDICPTQDELCDPELTLCEDIYCSSGSGMVNGVGSGCSQYTSNCCETNCCEDNPGNVPAEQLCQLLEIYSMSAAPLVMGFNPCNDYNFDFEFCPCGSDEREATEVCEDILLGSTQKSSSGKGGKGKSSVAEPFEVPDMCVDSCANYVTNCCDA